MFQLTAEQRQRRFAEVLSKSFSFLFSTYASFGVGEPVGVGMIQALHQLHGLVPPYSPLVPIIEEFENQWNRDDKQGVKYTFNSLMRESGVHNNFVVHEEDEGEEEVQEAKSTKRSVLW